jgi:hypothetical protein
VRDVVNISLSGDGWGKTYEARVSALLSSAADITSTESIMVVQPDVTQSGKNIPGIQVITQLGFQIPLMKYYVNDVELEQYDRVFDLHRTGLVPLEFIESIESN